MNAAYSCSTVARCPALSPGELLPKWVHREQRENQERAEALSSAGLAAHTAVPFQLRNKSLSPLPGVPG